MVRSRFSAFCAQAVSAGRAPFLSWRKMSVAPSLPSNTCHTEEAWCAQPSTRLVEAE